MALMFCRFCGVHLPDDSLFCAKCGKRLGRNAHPALAKWVAFLRLRTPYPYFGVLIALGVAWAISNGNPHFDYAQTKWSIEKDQKLDVPDEKLYRESLSLVVENTAARSVRAIPIEVHARIEPQEPADVVAAFSGDRETVIEAGKPRPVGILLSDSIAAGAKRRYLLDASVQAMPPFKVTFDVMKDDGRTVLTSYVLER
jgi:hypothetical protein